MAGNTIGNIFRLTTFGESHGPSIGGIIDGCPSGIKLDMGMIKAEMARRRPGQSALTTPRNELDAVEFQSGLLDGTTTGTPIGFLIRNTNQRSSDYNAMQQTYRPSHADYTWDEKFGIRDVSGGGRSSARETAARVVAGAIAKQFLAHYDITVQAYTSSIGNVHMSKSYAELDLSMTESNDVRCPETELVAQMTALIETVRDAGDTIGGAVSCVIKGVPPGIGEPVFDKLHAELAKAIVSINAVKGFEIGSGFGSLGLKGSEHNDAFYNQDGRILTRTNNSGGVQGGISNGMDIYFRAAFKPVATIKIEQQTVDTKGQDTTLKAEGRHDPCVVPRAVPIVEAMAALVVADYLLMARTNKCDFY